ncbi:hypothetical protein SCP_1801470 [Sparassis crispa]|uniref:Uncharacterized protein n=1 Tax=Sparassis crispa TaxID=139825 RepID=A0A401H6W6_9APHY|nr:hypothetical protein SCP_1801470 [Sparassis crispa]GBE90123.1 hypothetical protein SCP_1801470 [Sparassis crispa]
MRRTAYLSFPHAHNINGILLIYSPSQYHLSLIELPPPLSRIHIHPLAAPTSSDLAMLKSEAYCYVLIEDDENASLEKGCVSPTTPTPPPKSRRVAAWISRLYQARKERMRTRSRGPPRAKPAPASTPTEDFSTGVSLLPERRQEQLRWLLYSQSISWGYCVCL